MKVIIQEKVNKIEFPCLMIADGGLIILALGLERNLAGIVLADSNHTYRVGYYGTSFGIEHFTPYRGTVTLSNGDA